MPCAGTYLGGCCTEGPQPICQGPASAGLGEGGVYSVSFAYTHDPEGYTAYIIARDPSGAIQGPAIARGPWTWRTTRYRPLGESGFAQPTFGFRGQPFTLWPIFTSVDQTFGEVEGTFTVPVGGGGPYCSFFQPRPFVRINYERLVFTAEYAGPVPAP